MINKRIIASIMACLILIGGVVVTPTSQTSAAGTISKSISMVVKTKTSADLYWIKDGTRHPFPNSSVGAKIYQSWFPDYSNVKVISDARMQWIEIGKSVSPKPGSMMLKFENDNKVYEVIGENKLSLIETEMEAAEKYGSNWQLKINVIPSVYFTDYEIE